MKNVILATTAAVVFVAACRSTHAQGPVEFGNHAESRITNALTGEFIFGTNTYRFGLYYGPEGSTADRLTLLALAVNVPSSSPTAAAAGGFAGGPVQVPGGTEVNPVVIQVRGWSYHAGTSYEAAYDAALAGDPDVVLGVSSLVLVGPSVPPGPTTGLFRPVGPLDGFTVGPIPEPSVLALALLGAGMLGLRFRTWRRSRCPIERKARRPSVSATVALGFCLLFSAHGYGQGRFLVSNRTAPTRLGSIDGPLAGRGIWAQMEVGLTPSSLSPVDVPVEHVTNGLVYGYLNHSVTLPGILPGTTVYLQMLAWDGQLWGTTLAEVPPRQLGRTDIVGLMLSGGTQPDP